MQRVLAPHLALMRQDVRSTCPDTDPELALIQWLCQRACVKPPQETSTFQKMSPRCNAAPEREVEERVALSLPPLLRPEAPPLGMSAAAEQRIKVAETSTEAPFARGKLATCPHRRDQTKLLTRDVQLEMSRKLLVKVPLFADCLSEKEQYELIGKMRIRFYSAGEAIAQRGDVGHELVIVREGMCEIFVESEGSPAVVGSIQKDGCFGELALLYDRPFAATVIAKNNVTVLTLSREDLHSTLGDDFLSRLRLAAYARLFDTIPLLSRLWQAAKSQIARLMRPETWSAGSILTKQSAHTISRKMFLLEEGRCERVYEGCTTWTMENGCQSLQPEILHPGQHFGMLSMFFGSPANCTITAVTAVKTVSLGYADLMEKCGQDDEGTCVKDLMQKSMRCHLLRHMEQLKTLEEDLLHVVAEHAHETRYCAYDVIFKKGAHPDTVFILQEGRVFELEGDVMALQPSAPTSGEVDSRRETTSGREHSQPGKFFGTRCLRDGQAAMLNTLVARSDCSILCISGGVLRSIFKRQGPCSRRAFDPASEII